MRFDERMSDLEALMWGLEQVSPSLQSVMTMVGVLDRPADPQRVLSRLESTCSDVPRLRERVEPGALPTVPPRWVEAPGFDVARHLETITLDGGGILEGGGTLEGGNSVRGGDGFDALSEAVEGVIDEPFPAGRPPWQVTLLDGLDCGRGGFVARLHHSYTDGQGAIRIALGLFDEAEEAAPGETAASTDPRGQHDARSEHVGRPPPAGGLLEDVIHEVDAAVSVARKVMPWMARSLRGVMADPGGAASRAAELMSSVGRIARDAGQPGSPLLTPRSGETRVASVSIGLEEMRSAGRRHGGTINDVFLAGTLAGLSAYHSKMGAPAPSVKLGIPVSTRTGGDSMHNQLQGMLVRGPMNLYDWGELVRLMHEVVAVTRAQPWLGFVDGAAAAANRIPFLSRNLLAEAVSRTEVLVSNLPGPPDALHFGGSTVESLVPFGPRAGSALNLTLLSYAGAAHIGINADSAAITDVGMLADCLRSGFADVLA